MSRISAGMLGACGNLSDQAENRRVDDLKIVAYQAALRCWHHRN
jgi:hypothetical protein